MNILLVEPKWKIKRARNLPVALQKMATYFIDRGHSVSFFKGNMPIGKKGGFLPLDKSHDFDLVCITTLFVYHHKLVIDCIRHYQDCLPGSEIRVGGVLATLMPDYIREKTGIVPHVGLWGDIDSCLSNFDLFVNNENYKYNDSFGVIFTSRGCIRKCEFCSVKTLEPDFFIVDNWREQIDNVVKNRCIKLLVQDNNFTATPWSHQVDFVNYVCNNYNDKIEVDFNQALDCRIFSKKHAELYSKIRFLPLRFAFDGMQEDGFFQRAVEFTKKYGIFKRDGIIVYALYNFVDTPEEFYYRLKEIINSGCIPFPMKYAPVYDLNSKKYVGDHWTDLQLKNFVQISRHLSGGRGILPNRKHVVDYLEKGQQYFIDQLNRTDIYPTYIRSKIEKNKGKVFF